MLLQLTLLDTIFSLIIFAVVVTVPGYFWTLAFYPEKNSVSKLERAAFSVLFSVTILPMAVLLENTLLGLPVDFFWVLSTLLGLAIVSLLIYLIRSSRVGAPQFVYNFFPKIKKEDSVEVVPKIFK